jgi:hypothetical protein
MGGIQSKTFAMQLRQITEKAKRAEVTSIASTF